MITIKIKSDNQGEGKTEIAVAIEKMLKAKFAKSGSRRKILVWDKESKKGMKKACVRQLYEREGVAVLIYVKQS